MEGGRRARKELVLLIGSRPEQPRLPLVEALRKSITRNAAQNTLAGGARGGEAPRTRVVGGGGRCASTGVNCGAFLERVRHQERLAWGRGRRAHPHAPSLKVCQRVRPRPHCRARDSIGDWRDKDGFALCSVALASEEPDWGMHGDWVPV